MSELSDSKLEIAVHSAPDLAEDNYAPRWIEALESLGVKIRIRDFDAPGSIDRLRGVDGVMWHYYHSLRAWLWRGIKGVRYVFTGKLSPVLDNRASGFHRRNRPGELRISEISYCYLNLAVFECPGHWDRNLVWHSGQIWPERAHAEDFLREVSEGRGA